jgi:alkylated DNA repair dioxygenase AlkB
MALPPGLSVYPDILTPEQEQTIVAWLDTQPWSTALARRTQHYGYEYNYTSRTPRPTQPMVGPIQSVAEWIDQQGWMRPQQCIVNEYRRNQGISAHTDAGSFGPVIISISLLEPTNMVFQPIPGRATGDSQSQIGPVTLTLEPRSLLLMTGESRYHWKHSIPVRTTVHRVDGSTYSKPETYRRISLTYRTVVGAEN